MRCNNLKSSETYIFSTREVKTAMQSCTRKLEEYSSVVSSPKGSKFKQYFHTPVKFLRLKEFIDFYNNIKEANLHKLTWFFLSGPRLGAKEQDTLYQTNCQLVELMGELCPRDQHHCNLQVELVTMMVILPLFIAIGVTLLNGFSGCGKICSVVASIVLPFGGSGREDDDDIVASVAIRLAVLAISNTMLNGISGGGEICSMVVSIVGSGG
ncbi:hypothetical protein DFJ73DRAFT_756673 [Zopfochytrium polystomum]|nr:hypothetical protein DFJ73DRAFT_756673 [Zopfochytrium polystomum]